MKIERPNNKKKRQLTNIDFFLFFFHLSRRLTLSRSLFVPYLKINEKVFIKVSKVLINNNTKYNKNKNKNKRKKLNIENRQMQQNY